MLSVPSAPNALCVNRQNVKSSYPMIAIYYVRSFQRINLLRSTNKKVTQDAKANEYISLMDDYENNMNNVYRCECANHFRIFVCLQRLKIWKKIGQVTHAHICMVTLEASIYHYKRFCVV